MKTLVEASAAFDQSAGIGRYSRNILSRLLAQSPEDAWTLVRAPVERAAPSRFDVPEREGVRTVTLPFSRRNADRLWFRLRLPIDIRLFAGGADVVYSPDFTAPPMAGVPRMITVHDLAFLTNPDQTTEALQRYLSDVVPREVERAERVAVVSESTREDVRRLLGVPEEKLVLARNAVDDVFRQAQPLTEEARRRIGLPDRYLLMVGTIEPRKNHLGAMRAHEVAGLGADVPLLIAGRPGWGYAPIMAEAERLAAKGGVILLDYVGDEDLPGVYASADALVYPSWTEGFGLPVVEALATGTAVITGTAPALREAGGREALYAEPDDIDGLAAHMRRVVETPATAEDRARRQAWTGRFSWDSSTSTVLRSLREIAMTR